MQKGSDSCSGPDNLYIYTEYEIALCLDCSECLPTASSSDYLKVRLKCWRQLNCIFILTTLRPKPYCTPSYNQIGSISLQWQKWTTIFLQNFLVSELVYSYTRKGFLNDISNIYCMRWLNLFTLYLTRAYVNIGVILEMKTKIVDWVEKGSYRIQVRTGKDPILCTNCLIASRFQDICLIFWASDLTAEMCSVQSLFSPENHPVFFFILLLYIPFFNTLESQVQPRFY